MELSSNKPSVAHTYVVFRYDDLAGDQPGERETNPHRRAIWESEQAVDRLFENAGLPYVVGVIPQANPAYLLRSKAGQSFPLSADQEKVNLVKRSMAAGRMQVAMHGFNHTNHSQPKGRASEFSRDYEEQYRDLVAGRKILTDALGQNQISTFIPPFNGWNEHTARALVNSGFRILSADRHQPGDAVTPLTNIPFTAQLWELEELLVQDRLPTDSLVVALYHPPQIARIPNHEHRYYGIERMKALLDRLAARPEIRVVNLEYLQASCADLTPGRYMAAARLQRMKALWTPLLPAKFRPGTSKDFIYLPEKEYLLCCGHWMIWTMIATIGAIVGSLVFFGVVSNWVSQTLNRLLIGGTLLGFLTGIWLIRDIQGRGFHINSIRFFYAVIMGALLFATIRNEWLLSVQH